MKTVRQQVLEYLEAHRASTAEEIARAFKMTGANARYHLSVLIAEGAVEILGIIQDGSPGRPRQRYSPTRLVHRHNLDRLAHALLIVEEQGGNETRLEQLAGSIWAEGEAIQLSGTTPPVREHLTRRLAQVVRKLNRMNYDARWEAHAQAPRLIFNHCPYAAIIAQHPELCQMDALLLQQALGQTVTQQVKLGSDINGLSYCVFVLRGK